MLWRAFVLLVVLSTSAAHAAPMFVDWGFETNKTKKMAKQDEVRAKIQELKLSYLQSHKISKSDLLEALKALHRVCELGSTDYQFPDYQLRSLPLAAVPFWREAVRIANTYENYYFVCNERLLYTLLPAPWDETTWNSLRREIREAQRAGKSSVPDWAFVMEVLAARPQPEHNPIPQNIQDKVQRFAVATLGMPARSVRGDSPAAFWDNVEEQLGALAELSDSANAGEEEYRVQAMAYNRSQVSREAVDHAVAAVRLGRPLPSPTFQPVFHAGFVQIASDNRGVGLALEAIRPGALTVQRPGIAAQILYPEDIQAILEARAPSCASLLSGNPT